jgi:ankyrin repeat protein
LFRLQKNIFCDTFVQFGWTPVHLAARAGNEDVLKKLLLYGVEIDQRDNVNIKSFTLFLICF